MAYNIPTKIGQSSTDNRQVLAKLPKNKESTFNKRIVGTGFDNTPISGVRIKFSTYPAATVLTDPRGFTVYTTDTAFLDDATIINGYITSPIIWVNRPDTYVVCTCVVENSADHLESKVISITDNIAKNTIPQFTKVTCSNGVSGYFITHRGVYYSRLISNYRHQTPVEYMFLCDSDGKIIEIPSSNTIKMVDTTDVMKNKHRFDFKSIIDLSISKNIKLTYEVSTGTYISNGVRLIPGYSAQHIIVLNDTIYRYDCVIHHNYKYNSSPTFAISNIRKLIPHTEYVGAYDVVKTNCDSIETTEITESDIEKQLVYNANNRISSNYYVYIKLAKAPEYI